MKKILLFCTALVLCLSSARADEGMWLLKLMKQQHLEDSLRRAGLQLPPEALYSETSPSLRECIGIFGRGCTGEVVSPDGLILTNHHCGFSYVHEMSGIGHDYMKDGYFAKSRAEELRTPESLTFTFVVRIVDVTAEVEAEAAKQKADDYTRQSQAFLEPMAKKLLKKSDLAKKKGMDVRIVPYFGGNQFYAFFEQTYSDIRLVANPPYNVGQFGGNSDNWIWPRQNADFAMFRIYADKNGQPAPYSEKNVPLKVKKYLPISLKGVNDKDYTMIMGFPGSTSRYLTASEVALRTQQMNAPIVLAGNPLLNYYKQLMDQSDELRLLLEDEYFSWGNAVKNYGGMNEAVEKIRLIDQKKAEEAQFRAFAAKAGKPEYLHVIDSIDQLCKTFGDNVHDLALFRITLSEQELHFPTRLIEKYREALKGGKAKKIEAAKAANVAIDAPCNGNGSCGKCRVKLVSGDVTGIFNQLQEDVQAAGVDFTNDFVQALVELDEPTLDDTMPDTERLSRFAQAAFDGCTEVRLTYHTVKKLAKTLRDANFKVLVSGTLTDGVLTVMDVSEKPDAPISARRPSPAFSWTLPPARSRPRPRPATARSATARTSSTASSSSRSPAASSACRTRSSKRRFCRWSRRCANRRASPSRAFSASASPPTPR